VPNNNNWPKEEMVDWKQLCERRKKNALICVGETTRMIMCIPKPM
jgi:hypothetical protein